MRYSFLTVRRYFIHGKCHLTIILLSFFLYSLNIQPEWFKNPVPNIVLFCSKIHSHCIQYYYMQCLIKIAIVYNAVLIYVMIYTCDNSSFFLLLCRYSDLTKTLYSIHKHPLASRKVIQGKTIHFTSGTWYPNSGDSIDEVPEVTILKSFIS